LEVMARGNKTRKLQDMSSQPPAAPDRDASRVEESVHPTYDQRRYGDVAQPDLIADRIATAVASALRNTDKDYSIERATKLGAKVFTGTADPVDAESWMVRIERIFDFMDCPDDRKLRLATFLLEGSAYDWWRSVQSKYVDPSVITWGEFKDDFNEHFYPRSYKTDKQNEFLRLVQTSTVAEYQKKFLELSKYAAALVADEVDKCRRFEYGLKEEIRSVVTASGYENLGKLVEALRVEKILSERHGSQQQMRLGIGSNSQSWAGRSMIRPSRRDRRGGGLGISTSGSFKSRSHGSQGSRSSEGSVQQPGSNRTQTQRSSQRSFTPGQSDSSGVARFPQCQLCGKFHPSECLKGIGVCYHCGQTGHMRRECPVHFQQGSIPHGVSLQSGAGITRQNQNQNILAGKAGATSATQSDAAGSGGTRQKGQAGRPRTQGRVFAVTQHDADELPDVVMGGDKEVGRAYRPV
ncbi:uncharacterized protein LOC111369392 isoform X1, partial [Olea europaea subsp. europaea]